MGCNARKTNNKQHILSTDITNGMWLKIAVQLLLTRSRGVKQLSETYTVLRELGLEAYVQICGDLTTEHAQATTQTEGKRIFCLSSLRNSARLCTSL